MNRLGAVVVLLAALSTTGTAQPQRFVGDWEARFKGDVFLTLKLQEGEPISGTMSGGSIRVDDDGNLTEASGGGDELPISKAVIEGDTLSFDWKGSDDETLRIRMRVTGDGEAQLQFMGLPEGLKMKPFTLKRK
ncbi:MAG: hypothetical protein ABSH09_00155 [Bryobacteraceae bacterium]|jgi:hypothetical protein